MKKAEKQRISVLLILCIVIIFLVEVPIVGFAKEETFEVITGATEKTTEYKLKYKVIEAGKVEVSGYTGSSISVTIPTSVAITVGGDGSEKAIYNVVRVGGSAFYNCTSLASITLPDSITSIGDGAFFGCTKLNTITLPDSVGSIGYSAFNRCESLNNIEIPEGVTSIKKHTFSNCKKLSSISLPNSLETIGFSVFSECTSLTAIRLPNSITSIGGHPFAGCINLETLEVSSGPSIELKYASNLKAPNENGKLVFIDVNGEELTRDALSNMQSSYIKHAGTKDNSWYGWNIGPDLSGYFDVLDKVVQDEYTVESWNTYQQVVTANTVTVRNTTDEVVTATREILKAQEILVKPTPTPTPTPIPIPEKREPQDSISDLTARPALTPEPSSTPSKKSKDKKITIQVPTDKDQKNKKDYKIIIKAGDKDKEISVKIPKDKKMKVIFDLPKNLPLPKLEVIKGDISLVIPKGIKVTSGDSSDIEFITSKDVKDKETRNKVKGIMTKNQILDSVEHVFIMGGNERKEFNDFITLRFEGLKGKDVGYIQEGQLYLIHKYKNDEKGRKSGNMEYAYENGDDLIVKTKHFTDFIAYTTRKIQDVNLEKIYKDSKDISSWAYESIKKATALGFVEGLDNNISPKKTINRAEFTKIIASIFELDLDIENTMDFDDISKNDWFYPYINTAYKAGIIKGNRDKFNPYGNITREEMAAIIVRALELEKQNPSKMIKDIDMVSDWAKEDVETVVALGLIVGYDNIFDSKSYVSREVAMVVAIRVYDYK